jgi:hypothetical protein
MSNFKKVPVAGGGPRRDVLASLKMASMEFSKPYLPAGMPSNSTGSKIELTEANIT